MPRSWACPPADHARFIKVACGELALDRADALLAPLPGAPPIVTSELSHAEPAAPTDATELAALRELGTAAGPLERLLLAHLARCWTRLRVAEQQYGEQSLGASTVEQALAWEQRLSATHARYLQALQMFAWVRQLTTAGVAIPALPVEDADGAIALPSDVATTVEHAPASSPGGPAG